MILCSILLTAVATSPIDGDTAKVKTVRRHAMNPDGAPPEPPLTSLLETLREKLRETLDAQVLPTQTKAAVDLISPKLGELGAGKFDVEALQAGLDALDTALKGDGNALNKNAAANAKYFQLWKAGLEAVKGSYGAYGKESLENFIAELEAEQAKIDQGGVGGGPTTAEAAYDAAKTKLLQDLLPAIAGVNKLDDPSQWANYDKAAMNADALEALIGTAKAAFDAGGKSAELTEANKKLQELRQEDYDNAKGALADKAPTGEGLEGDWSQTPVGFTPSTKAELLQFLKKADETFDKLQLVKPTATKDELEIARTHINQLS
jgi:hypothetical protein